MLAKSKEPLSVNGEQSSETSGKETWTGYVHASRNGLMLEEQVYSDVRQAYYYEDLPNQWNLLPSG